ncbi:hypothetical protein BDK51DRAFT_48523 [Blyttiomyces helicus]|uniref:Uncharacterized protein n=1 Tax=Blyttiomyces helicus TaxID=388810 RepID=A0A4P9W4H5_9FUNG|nr:hypothetical protein BDK51DRAFT_48523 [Blyttiomyces helicus]|eukprot:RKO86183.1 hypothetical protein BDK51DRAFT_48523 [Blyttiomyces helicus]
MDLSLERWAHHDKLLAQRPEAGSDKIAEWAASAQAYKEVVFFLHANRSEGCDNKAMLYAITFGHIPSMQFLHEIRHEKKGDMEIEHEVECERWKAVMTFLRTHRIDHRPESDIMNEVVLWRCPDIVLVVLATRPEVYCYKAAMMTAFISGATNTLRVMYAADDRLSDHRVQRLFEQYSAKMKAGYSARLVDFFYVRCTS